MFNEKALNRLGEKLLLVSYDPLAKVSYELFSDALIWEDEEMMGLEDDELSCLRALLRYRTCLMINEPDESLKDIWDRAQKDFADWIGFREDRCSATPELIKIYKLGVRKDPIFGLFVIEPYKHDQLWVFDDEEVGLDKEPFVDGADEMIDVLVVNIPNADKGFMLKFGEELFPDYQVKLEWRRKEHGGDTYYSSELDQEGWLCPALLQYFRQPPKEIYIQCEAKS